MGHHVHDQATNKDPYPLSFFGVVDLALWMFMDGYFACSQILDMISIKWHLSQNAGFHVDCDVIGFTYGPLTWQKMMKKSSMYLHASIPWRFIDGGTHLSKYAWYLSNAWSITLITTLKYAKNSLG